MSPHAFIKNGRFVMMREIRLCKPLHLRQRAVPMFSSTSPPQTRQPLSVVSNAVISALLVDPGSAMQVLGGVKAAALVGGGGAVAPVVMA